MLCFVFRSLLALLLAYAPIAAALEVASVASCGPNMPKKTQTLEGLFRVHVVCDQVLFEVPPKLLDRDILVNVEFAALSSGTDYVAPGSVAASGVRRWVRRGNKLYWEKVTYEMFAQNQPNLQRGVEAGSLRSVVAVFDAVAEGQDGALIIDATPLYTTHVPPGFAVEFMQHFRMSQVDARSSYVESVKAFPENVNVRFFQTWTADRKVVLETAGSDNPVPASLGFVFSASYYLLPEAPMRGRYADARVGYFQTQFRDYGAADIGGVTRGHIQRYRLEKRNPNAAVSEPIKPIVFYISREVPDLWRPYMKQGVEAWQVVFEQAGFRNAIIARDAPTQEEDPDWDPEDVRYNVIRWTPSGRQNAMGPAVVDPRSGEVISSHAIFWHDVLRLLETWYFTQAGAVDPRAHKLPLPSDLMGELLAYVVTHEVGHALGLRHNFKASSAVSTSELRDPKWTAQWGTSASIMSYARFNYVAQPGDKAGLLPKFGPYDYFAIDWGYRQFDEVLTPDDEWALLDELAARQVAEPLLRWGGEDSVSPIDPTVSEHVLSNDPVEGARLGLQNIDRIAGLLVPATTRKGHGYAKLGRLYEALITQRHRELAYVTKLVGGVEEIRYQAERGSVPFKPVAPMRQREAVRFLADHAFSTPNGLLELAILQRVAPSGVYAPLQGSNIDLLRRLIDPTVFARMSEARAFYDQGYLGLDMLQDLNGGLFGELDQKEPVVSLYRRELQRNYVTLLMAETGALQSSGAGGSRDVNVSYSSSLAALAESFRNGADKPSEYRAALRSGVADLYRRIDAALPRVQDRETELHLRMLRASLARVP